LQQLDEEEHCIHSFSGALKTEQLQIIAKLTSPWDKTHRQKIKFLQSANGFSCMRSEPESRSDLKLFCEVVLDVQTAATARDNNRESAVGQTRPWDPCSAQVDENASFGILIMNLTTGCPWMKLSIYRMDSDFSLGSVQSKSDHKIVVRYLLKQNWVFLNSFTKDQKLLINLLFLAIFNHFFLGDLIPIFIFS
jgi:hypothetical protein